jgi:hypothetical protein
MKLKIGQKYCVRSVTPVWHFAFAKLVMSTSLTIPRAEWLINGYRYDFDFWVVY